MSNQTTDHVIRMSADFSDFVREAKKAGDKSSAVVAKALEAGIKKRSFVGYMNGLKNFEKKRTQLEKKFQALSYAQEAQNAGKVGRKLQEVQEKLANLTRDLNSETLSQDIKARKTAERNLFKEKCKLLQQLNNNEMEGFSEALRAANQELEAITTEQLKAAKALDRTTDQVVRGAERAAEFMKMFRRDAIKGADEFNERLEGSITNLRSGLQNINIGEMLSGGSAGLGKGIGNLAEMAKGLGAVGGAMGVLATGLGAALTVLGPLVILAGALGAVLFEMDKEVKEFNKSVINTFGTRSVMNVGMPTLDDNLKVIRHSVQDLTATLGLTEQEALGVFDAFDAGGYSLGRFTKGAVDAADAENRLQVAMRSTVSVAKSLGVGVSEFAGTLAEYTDTLAFSLENVTGQFALVAKQATDAGFSTRRFYSLITQASAGQASLNTHLDQTADLLIKMTKTLGEKQAAEVIGGAAGGYKDVSTSDRYRAIMTTGQGRTKNVIDRSAQRQASSFLQDLSQTMNQGEIDRAIQMAGQSGVSISKAAREDTSGQTLVKELANLSRSDQEVITAAFESSTDKTVSSLGRQLDQLTTVARGTTGEMADMADAMSGLDPGATIAMKLQSAMAILGRPLDELTGIDRMAAEQITGMSGAQIEQYQALARASEGSYRLLQTSAQHPPATAAELEALQKEQDQRFGAHITKNGEIADQNGAAVTSSMDLLTATIERGDTQVTEARDEAMSLAYDAFDATTTIADILENKILFYVRGLYEDVGQPLITWLSKTLGLGGGSEARQAAISARGALQDTSRRAMDSGSQASRTISQLSTKEAQGTLSPEETAQLASARRTAEESRAIMSEVSTELRKLSSGDYSGLTGTKTVAGGGHMSGAAMGRSGLDAADAAATTTTQSYTLSGSEAARRVEERARARLGGGGGGGGQAVTAATEEQAALVTDPIVKTLDASSAVTRDEHAETRSTMETIGDEANKHLTKIMTKDRKVGDMIAKSDLPDAIVAAQVKQQFASLAFASGLDPEKASEALDTYFQTGTLTPELQAAISGSGGFEEGSALAGSLANLGIMPGARGAATAGRAHRFPMDTGSEAGTSPDIAPEVNDFIYRGGGVRGSITPIDSADVLVGSKEGGALDRAGAGGGTINNNFHIYGGDERRVFDVVKRVLRESGVTPGRVTTRA